MIRILQMFWDSIGCDNKLTETKEPLLKNKTLLTTHHQKSVLFKFKIQFSTPCLSTQPSRFLKFVARLFLSDMFKFLRDTEVKEALFILRNVYLMLGPSHIRRRIVENYYFFTIRCKLLNQSCLN